MDLGDVCNPRTSQKRRCVSANLFVEIQSERWWEAAYGVCPGTAGVADISVLNDQLVG